MPTTLLPVAVIEDAVHLACRAPSYHNSQPWRWVIHAGTVSMFVDPDHLVASDAGGRQALISCGAALDHFRVAMTAGGYTAHVERYPNRTGASEATGNDHDQHHIVDITLSKLTDVTAAQRRRADAILHRRTDRLPFAEPPNWDSFERLMRSSTDLAGSALDVIDIADRETLAEASHLTDAMRLYDSEYHHEITWWTSPYEVNDGIPHTSLVSAQEADRVDVGRTFPVTHHRERRLEVGEDQARLLVISASDDTRQGILAAGEALSAVLLDATMAGMSSCTLSHLTEVPISRDIVAALVNRPFPQVVVRLGIAPALEEVPPPTPRRPLHDVLRVEI
ncbi:Acg family FMN-binding oxidoreductase [Mycobacterium sp. BMJ-28]